MYKKGFTLAEVLITLMIIGIVAALTIPSVISNYQQMEFKTGLKKAVSVLNEAIQTNIAQEGETPYENANLYSYLQRHMSIIKTNQFSFCYGGIDSSFAEPREDGRCQQRYAYNDFWVSNQAFYTTDGMRFEIGPLFHNRPVYLHETGTDIAAIATNLDGGYRFYNENVGNCGSYGLSKNPKDTKTPPCVLLVDVNGDRKPNPPKSYVKPTVTNRYVANVGYVTETTINNQTFKYSYSSPSDKKLQDIFTIMITDEKAVPFGVVAQRAMYSK